MTDELSVTNRHDTDRDVDVAEYDGQDIATIEFGDSGVVVAYGGARQERTRDFDSPEAARIWIAEHADDLVDPDAIGFF
jgi:hypothetical protein